MAIGDLINDAVDLLGRLHENTLSQEERVLLLVSSEALRFIWDTGQTRAFTEYRKTLSVDSPPHIVAAFASQEDAEVWLNNHPQPPDMAYVLIGDRYHVVADFSESHRRALLPYPSLERYLDSLLKEGLPPAVATFQSREEAASWWNSQVHSAAQAIIQIGNEPYLAVNYGHLPHRALFPFSLAQRLKTARE
jgi:hypothetical protein